MISKTLFARPQSEAIGRMLSFIGQMKVSRDEGYKASRFDMPQPIYVASHVPCFNSRTSSSSLLFLFRLATLCQQPAKTSL